MEMLGSYISMHEGEGISLKIELFQVQDDKQVPFALRTMENPYLLLSIASDTHDMHKRVEDNIWLDLSSYPSWTNNKWKHSSILDEYYTDGETEDLRIIIKSTKTQEFVNYNSFVIPNVLLNGFYYGINDYGEFYWFCESENGDDFTKVSAHKFEVKFDIEPVITKRWNDGQYTYEIRLISGETMNSMLTGMYKSLYGDANVPVANYDLYQAIKESKPDLVKYVDYNVPIGRIETNENIQKLEKIIIKANNWR